jgi:predicted  nucleic acid-binding Zn-ribbon protein
MSDTHARTRASRRATGKVPNPVETPTPSRELAANRKRAAREIAALVNLALLDAALSDRQDERHSLGAKLSPDIRDAYERAVRGGRNPAVVSLVASVCSGCHVRLHSTLEQKIRRRRGVAACPHCLRVVYDPAWLAP